MIRDDSTLREAIMGARAEALAKQFEVKAQEASAIFESLTDAEWKKKTSSEKWPVGVVAHHIAVSHELIAGIIKTIADGKPLPEISLRFAEWIAKYTLAPLGMTVRMLMSARAVFEPQKPRFGVTIVEGAAEPPRMTPARQRALEIAGDGAIRAKAALAAAAQCSTGVVNGLVASGNLVEVVIPEKRPPVPDPHHLLRRLRPTRGRQQSATCCHGPHGADDGASLRVHQRASHRLPPCSTRSPPT